VWGNVACADRGPGYSDAAPRAGGADPPDAAAGVPDGGAPIFGDERPAVVQVPPGHDPAVPAPLLIALHGYGSNGAFVTGYAGLDELVDQTGILVATPEGTRDGDGYQFWNATDACCDFAGSGVDDVAYLTRLIEQIRAAYSVDASRIFLVGHSNGGFMAYRMACERADLIAGVVSLAGATHVDAVDCAPSEPVSVLQIHGDLDATVDYDGGTLPSSDTPYPGARKTLAHWASYDGCAATTSAAAPLDLDALAAGAETAVDRADDCRPGIAAELWTVVGADHVVLFTSALAPALRDWIAAHPKPAQP
jgi:polyhydroxybutyrate depolymerase